jgi:hypothetical protein
LADRTGLRRGSPVDLDAILQMWIERRIVVSRAVDGCVA